MKRKRKDACEYGHFNLIRDNGDNTETNAKKREI